MEFKSHCRIWRNGRDWIWSYDPVDRLKKLGKWINLIIFLFRMSRPSLAVV